MHITEAVTERTTYAVSYPYLTLCVPLKEQVWSSPAHEIQFEELAVVVVDAVGVAVLDVVDVGAVDVVVAADDVRLVRSTCISNSPSSADADVAVASVASWTVFPVPPPQPAMNDTTSATAASEGIEGARRSLA